MFSLFLRPSRHTNSHKHIRTQDSSEGCDIAPADGQQYGSLYAAMPSGLYQSSGLACTGLCQSMTDQVNRLRRSYGVPPVCVSGKLMDAANAIMQNG